MLKTRSIFISATALLSSCTFVPSISGGGDYATQRDVVFTPQNWPARLVANLYAPEAASPTPAVLLIHGGGWNKSERRNDMAGIAKRLAKRGYFVMNMTYRLTPEWRFPAQREDVNQALRYLRTNADHFNIDPDHIATFGYSAGGHLAALAGLDPENQVRAIVAGGAPADLSFWPDGRLTGLLLGGPLEGHEALYREASPVTQVHPAAPPVFIYHGTADTLVPIEHPRAFIAVLEANDVIHEVYWIKGRSHILAHLFPASAIPDAIDFLDKHLKPATSE